MVQTGAVWCWVGLRVGCARSVFPPFSLSPDPPDLLELPVAMWAKRHLHREVARETVRCRHQALDRILLRPSSSFAGDPEECRRADGGPDEPGIGNVFESADNRAAFSGSFNGHARGA